MTQPHADAIARAARLLRRARYAIALTGAGISTPSGIPDFRSPDTGLWEEVNPMTVASIYSFRRNPGAFYNWIRPLAETLFAASPNPGHRALARLEEAGYLQAVITQNIDNLHQEAGSSEVLEVHGHLRTATCIECYHRQSTNGALRSLLESGEIPRCPHCGGVLKPDVVLFGEQLPIDVVNAAMAHVNAADLMLVAGSSLEVTPVSRLPLRIHRQGGRLIVVNLGATYIDDAADVVIHGDVATVLPRIARACGA
ncbi:MAG: Sir2 family NAD-dependent protein deacetylase [Anaerolineae bacterium]|nr:Sir2 family NAD-dependent protein deacetylase [Anaerolineae bacterium]